MTDPTPAQVKRLLDACMNLGAYFAADACRVIAEWPDDENLAPYLQNLPVKVVREFDLALLSIQLGKMDSEDDEANQRTKYDTAMAEMRGQP